jgi:hypothetical protein
MATKMDKVRVVAGRVVMVGNEKRHRFASKYYYAVWVEDACGGNERCLLFTDRELKVAEERAKKNPEDCTKKCFIADLLD